jgi:phosphoglycerate dehydrogenase-like enzyme
MSTITSTAESSPNTPSNSVRKSAGLTGMRPKAFLLNTPDNPFFHDVLRPDALERLRELLDLDQRIVTPDSFPLLAKDLLEAEVLVGTWGFPIQLAKDLAALPKLRLVLYAGGSVKALARPFLERGIKVVSAQQTNAVAVAEFCLAQILLSNKGYFRNTRMCRRPDTAHQLLAYTGPGNYGQTVALLGYGAIARHLRGLLRGIHLKVLVVDPTINLSDAEDEEIELVSMERAFKDAMLVSNHLPNLENLQNVLGANFFRSMPENATFINTGRGQQVDELGLIEVLRERSDLTALLDVTNPEPPLPGSPLYDLPNVQLSSHIAGVVGKERRRLTDSIEAECQRFLQGEKLHYATRLEDLELMA